MKKIILSKVAVHANPTNLVKAMTKKYGDGVFYDADTHSVVKLEAEVIEKPVEKVIEKEVVSEEVEKETVSEEGKKPRQKRKKK